MADADDDGGVVEDVAIVPLRASFPDAFDTLPRLTGAAFLLRSADSLPHDEICRRCAMTTYEVTLRMADTKTVRRA